MEPRLGFAWRPTDRWVVRGGYGISQYMEGTGSNLRLPMNPPFFFESNVVYDKSTGAGTIATGFAELVPGTTPTGNVRAFDPNLRPQFTQQWNVFVERLLTSSMSLNVGYVGHHATNLVAPVEGNQPLPGVGDPATWAPLGHAPAALRGAAPHHDHRHDGVAGAAATTTRSRRASASARGTASSSWPRTRSARSSPTTCGYYGSGGVAPPRAPTG